MKQTLPLDKEKPRQAGYEAGRQFLPETGKDWVLPGSQGQIPERVVKENHHLTLQSPKI